MAKQSKEFPVKGVRVMSNMVVDSMATKNSWPGSEFFKLTGRQPLKGVIHICYFHYREFGCVHVHFRCEQAIRLILFADHQFYPPIRAFMGKVLTIKPQQFWPTTGHVGIRESYLGHFTIHIRKGN